MDSSARYWNRQCAPVLQDTKRACVLAPLSQLQLCVPVLLSLHANSAYLNINLLCSACHRWEVCFCAILFCPGCLSTCSTEILRVLESSDSMTYQNCKRLSRSSLTSMSHMVSVRVCAIRCWAAGLDHEEPGSVTTDTPRQNLTNTFLLLKIVIES